MRLLCPTCGRGGATLRPRPTVEPLTHYTGGLVLGRHRVNRACGPSEAGPCHPCQNLVVADCDHAMTATFSTIDDVIRRLTTIVDDAKTDGSRLGYFPALYRKVTAEVRDAIANGVFDDGPRMERLDAFDAYREGGALTRAWKFAFDVTGQWWPIVLQHPLLGINPHINLDLGVAAARVAPGTQLPALREDFNRINGLLASLVGEVQDELARIWTTRGY